MWWVEDHTADVCLVVRAPTWILLLEEAVLAYSGWLFPDRSPGATEVGEPRELSVSGSDTAATWVRFWRELHRLQAVERVAAVSALGTPESTHHEARVTASVVSLDALPPAHIEVKAVTWHGAEAREADDGGWVGRILLDV